MTPTEDHVIPAADGFAHRRSTDGAAATAALGAAVAALLRGGEIVLLHGPLGAGKTCFVQGLCRALDVADEVVSPTFTLVNTYAGRLTVHHLDFYRIGPGDDLDDIGVPAVLDDAAAGGAVVLAEWPGPLLAELGPAAPRLELLVLPGAAPDRREWHLRGVPAVPDAWRRVFTNGA